MAIKKICFLSALFIAILGVNYLPIKNVYAIEQSTSQTTDSDEIDTLLKAQTSNQNQTKDAETEKTEDESQDKNGVLYWKGWLGVIIAIYLITLVLIWTFIILAINAIWRWLKMR